MCNFCENCKIFSSAFIRRSNISNRSSSNNVKWTVTFNVLTSRFWLLYTYKYSWWKLPPSISIEEGLHRINVQTIIISAIPNQFSHQTTPDYLETWLFEYTLYSHEFYDVLNFGRKRSNCVALKLSLSVCLHFSRSRKLFTQDSFFIEWLTIFPSFMSSSLRTKNYALKPSENFFSSIKLHGVALNVYMFYVVRKSEHWNLMLLLKENWFFFL